MATERDPYRVLGLSSAASQAEITSAYRRLLREHHPDTRTHHQTPDPAADEDLQRILSAYARLRDPQHRAAHDRAAADPAAAEPEAESEAEPRRPPRAPTQPAGPIRIHVVVLGTPPPRRPPATGLWVSPVRWHR
ncbi:molecular chaperone DnaJ [Rhodococcus sp. ACS1]|uniref:J domain-containing protein n=1 Tax=Rhodococcus sp. ACS1 TaxID=2028570 RepID=UPI000BB15460|nr:J domain-containing protein [Rhodococcus sp. ACS1]PBC40012.1 molecular chaperone DnaJ [Rhodococcus sp. ACS1]